MGLQDHIGLVFLDPTDLRYLWVRRRRGELYSGKCSNVWLWNFPFSSNRVRPKDSSVAEAGEMGPGRVAV